MGSARLPARFPLTATRPGCRRATSYTFAVKARDAAGNTFAASNAITASALLPSVSCRRPWCTP
ncbi:hypothetical protein FXF52_31235 [Micromonospora sp. MP36]|nr:hypothetical protein FXF52_31235 [Micromonospora sp. MP36]